MRRVAITGYGIQSCLGLTRDEVADALKAGRSGIVLYPERKELGFRSALGGKLPEPDELPFPRRTVRQMGPSPRIAAYAAHRAIEHAGLPDELLKSDRTAMIIGHGGCMEDVYKQCGDFEDGKTLPGSALQRVMCDTVSANLSILFGTRGYSFTVSAACATGAAAVGQAFQLIQWVLQDRALCGGAMESSWEFASTSTRSRRCRPARTSPSAPRAPSIARATAWCPRAAAACWCSRSGTRP
jgi:3-oxoacyl-[acyl-carrier-protein] synthase-1